MNKKLRDCIREIEKGHPSVEKLQEYVKESMCLHRSYAEIKMMMEYYMFYEVICEGINPYIHSAQDIVDDLNEKIGLYFEQKPDEDARRKMASELLSLREEVIARMRVLTAYVDKFVIYEYVLNRVQYRFEDCEMQPSDEAFTKDLLSFIFSGKDNAARNDNIRVVIGQLPVRISRVKYFEMIKDSISVYKGGDKSSLDGFLYMFRTSAMLYRDENEGKYFTEFRSTIKELEEVDYENISKELYQIYVEKIGTQAAKLQDISDLYMLIGQLINELYSLCISEKYAGEEKPEQYGSQVIRGILSLFSGKDSDVWEEKGLSDASEEEKMDALGESFVKIEGKQEALFESLSASETALDHLLAGKAEILGEYGMKEEFMQLKRLFLLISSSIFADLSEKEEEGTVTERMAEECAAELIADCREFFKGKSRMVRRAVMANTLGKMPVFFKGAQEAADYISASLLQCEDEAEKYAAKQLLLEIMAE